METVLVHVLMWVLVYDLLRFLRKEVGPKEHKYDSYPPI